MLYIFWFINMLSFVDTFNAFFFDLVIVTKLND